MLQHLISALTSKAAIAVAVGTVAAGAAATAAPSLVGHSRSDDGDTAILDAAEADGTTTTTAAETTTTTAAPTTTTAAPATATAASGTAALATARCQDDDERSNRGLDSHDNEAWDDDGDKKCDDLDHSSGPGHADAQARVDDDGGGDHDDHRGRGHGDDDPDHDHDDEDEGGERRRGHDD